MEKRLSYPRPPASPPRVRSSRVRLESSRGPQLLSGPTAWPIRNATPNEESSDETLRVERWSLVK